MKIIVLRFLVIRVVMLWVTCVPSFKFIHTIYIDFITDKNLVNLLNKGTKFRINKKLNIHKVNCLFKKELDNFILKNCYTFNSQPIMFHEWKIAVLKDFRHFTSIYLNTISNQYSNVKNIFSILDFYKKNYVFCSVDKAANNFSIICKKNLCFKHCKWA